jgi:hypothetical protein
LCVNTLHQSQKYFKNFKRLNRDFCYISRDRSFDFVTKPLLKRYRYIHDTDTITDTVYIIVTHVNLNKMERDDTVTLRSRYKLILDNIKKNTTFRTCS